MAPSPNPPSSSHNANSANANNTNDTQTSTARLQIPQPLPHPIPPPLQSTVNASLLASNTIPTLHAALVNAAQASGWLENVKRRTLELLRNGECHSYGELMARIQKEAKEGVSVTNGVNGHGAVNGAGRDVVDVKVPEAVYQEGIRVLEGCLRGMVDVVTDE
ncbi:hypothetical protein MMC25_003792 [Agyrium rufum]|nr:hypothetical protein [Agyrium rufum]